MNSRSDGSGVTVLMVCPYDPYSVTGGVETVVRELLPRLKERGVRVKLLTFGNGDRTSKEDKVETAWVQTHEFPRIGLRIFSPTSLSCLLNRNPIDILHVQAFHSLTSLLAILFARRDGSLIVQPWYHGRSSDWIRNFLLRISKILFRIVRDKVDLYICASQEEKRLFQRELGATDERVLVLPPGYDIQRITRHQWTGSPNSSRVRVLFVGRLVEHKHPDVVVRALTLDPELDLVIIGEGPLEEDLRERVSMFGLDDRVDFLGPIPYDALLDAYSESDVLVLPSTNEAFGIVAGEAALVGCPVVVAESQALAHFVEMGIAVGVELPLTARKILRGIHEARGSSSRERALLVLNDWEVFSDHIIRLYRGLRQSDRTDLEFSPGDLG